MELRLLYEILVIFGLSVAVLLLCHRFRVPVIVGFLISGILAGPHGLGVVKSVHEVELLAEIGVVLLLFTIGVEFSLRNLLQIRRLVLLGGLLQVGLTIAAVFGISRAFGLTLQEALFFGFLISLSSTAIVLRLLQERAEVDSPHGRTVLGILIFQDVIVVPMMLLVPVLAGSTPAMNLPWPLLIAKGLGIVALVLVAAKWVVPWLLYEIARTKSREIFLIAIIAICLAAAWLTQSLGLSLALGAFMAGLIISESEYSHQALGNILPFRDIFASFFFISIGMLLDLGFLVKQPLFTLLVAAGILVLKVLFALLAAAILGKKLRTAVIAGLALGQVGEFSFILSKVGHSYGLLTGDLYQLFIASSILTMAATPFVLTAAPAVAALLQRSVGRWLPEADAEREFGPAPALKRHLVIIGYGINGRNVARAAKLAGIPYVILEINPETVQEQRKEGEPIVYGDATQEAVLDHIGLKAASVAVIVINDPAATRAITASVRRMNPTLHLIVRTRYLAEMEQLYIQGADEVIPEEFETSVEIFSRVLAKYLVPHEEIERFVGEIRAEGYQMLRSLALVREKRGPLEIELPDMEIATIRVPADSEWAGKTLGTLGLRKQYGVTVLAVRRGSEIIANPDGETLLAPDDLLVLLGKGVKIAETGCLAQGLDRSCKL